MGAFFLYHNDAELCLDEVSQLFEKKGFRAPRRFLFGSWNLWLYRKILAHSDNYLRDDQGSAIASCGTVVYRGLGYRDSLKRLLSDFRTGNLDQEQLLGSFCLVFWDGEIVSILMDRSGTFHVFANDVHTCLSSSFLGLLTASPSPLPLNRLALCEKMATGYIVSPDTLVEGIEQLDSDVAATFSYSSSGLQVLSVCARPPIELHNKGLRESIACQISRLQIHFKAMDALHREAHGDLGLSSGYDSRLLVACAKYLSTPIDLYTHGTQGVHEFEASIARQIATNRNQKLHQISTRRIEDLSADDTETLLNDALYFQDGRCANMGAFSEVHTKSYRLNVAGNNYLSWNGLGGEMYRNFYFSANRNVTLRHWMNRHVYYPFAPDAWGCRDDYESMHRRIIAKVSRRLGTDVSSQVSFLWLRRYYSEVRMPDCSAIKNDAHNQLSCFHTPFMDATLVAEALNATPYIGYAGSYQARLIQHIAPALAKLQTHYGHPLDHIPYKYRCTAFIRSLVPNYIHYIKMRRKLRRAETSFLTSYYGFSSQVRMLGEIHDVLSDVVFRGRFKDAMIHYAQRPTAIFVGSFLREFHHKIRF
jgi:hypothetical protein